jgi:hypothetical protein
MDEYSDIWIEQCSAARDIRDAWGTNKALGYLIGEKFLNYLRASDSSSDWREKIPLFTEEIKRIFTVEELKTYFATTTRRRVCRPRCDRRRVRIHAQGRHVRRRRDQRSRRRNIVRASTRASAERSRRISVKRSRPHARKSIEDIRTSDTIPTLKTNRIAAE